jgi:hypothetical protein
MIFMLSHYRLLARIQGQLFFLPKTPAPVLQGRGLNFLLERAYARCYKLIDDGGGTATGPNRPSPPRPWWPVPEQAANTTACSGRK